LVPSSAFATVGNPQEDAAIDVEHLGDATDGVANGLDDLVGRQVDELDGQIGDELFELEFLLNRQAGRLLELTAGGEVDDRRDHEDRLPDLHAVQRDLDREPIPVATTPVQLLVRPHGAGFGDRVEALTLQRVLTEQRVGQEHVDGQTNQLTAAVAKLAFDLLVGQHNRAIGVHDEHAMRQRFSCELEDLERILARNSPVCEHPRSNGID